MGSKQFEEALKKAISILSNPSKEFHGLENKTLEEVVGYYSRMLLLVAIAAGIFSLVFSVLRALYLDIFITIDIQYLRMLNYSFNQASAFIFFYLFAGTFLLSFISLLLKPFIKKLKFTELLKILMYSMAPILLFGWIPALPLPFLIWSLFLLVIGIRSYKSRPIKKKSIQNRD